MSEQRVFVAPQSAGDMPTPERIVELLAGFMVSKTLFSAIEFGVFGAIDADGVTVETLAERCGIPIRSARAIADLLVQPGLLIYDGERYRNAPDAEAFLSGRGPLNMAPLARYWDKVSYPAWTNAQTAYRTRQGVRGPMSEEQTAAYEAGVALITAETARDLATHYDFGAHRRLLDVGGGLGTFVKPILQRYASLGAVLVDLPEVVAQLEPHDRLEVLGADLFRDPLPTGFDAIIAANVLHLFSPEQNAELFRVLRLSAVEGARLLLVDWFREKGVPHVSARYGPGEFLMISGGDLYQPDEVSRWLTGAGWRVVGRQELPAPSSVLIAEPS
jgi:SAM-dependent methyltransferase